MLIIFTDVTGKTAEISGLAIHTAALDPTKSAAVSESGPRSFGSTGGDGGLALAAPLADKRIFFTARSAMTTWVVCSFPGAVFGMSPHRPAILSTQTKKWSRS